MVSKFGGIPVEDSGSRFGGVPVDQAEPPLGVEAQAPQQDLTLLQEANQAIRPVFDNPIGAVGGEVMAAVNRGAVNLLDFLVPDQINAILQVAGSKTRVPTLAEQPFIQRGTRGEFLEPGFVRNAVRVAGEMAVPAGATQSVVRAAARGLPALVSGAESISAGALRQAAQQTIPQAAASGALVGGGAEVGAEVGGAVGGETGEAVGALVGAIAAPIGAAGAIEASKRLVTPSARQFLQQAAPSTEGLRSAARRIYDEIDELGVTVNPGSVTRLSRQLRATARQEGFNRRIHPRVNAALDEFEAVENTGQSLSDIHTLRRVTNAAAKSSEPDEARLGRILVDRIDDFLDGLDNRMLDIPANVDVGDRFRDAGQLWRRAKKSEMLEEAFENARNQATGFENGLRVQFRSILNSRKRRKGFTAEELNAMRTVVRGDIAQNIAKAIGKFGFTEGQATNMLMGSLGVAAGAAVGDATGAVSVALAGQISKSLAQKLTRNNAELANAIVRAGANGREIVQAYLRSVPRSQRSSQELSELLLNRNASLRALGAQQPEDARRLINDAAFFTNVLRREQENGQIQ